MGDRPEEEKERSVELWRFKEGDRPEKEKERSVELWRFKEGDRPENEKGGSELKIGAEPRTKKGLPNCDNLKRD